MEMLDVYDKSGKHIGIMERNKAHEKNPGVFHKGVHIWIINDSGEILVQKRSAIKKESPNEWDISCAGHIDAGEDSLTTCQRELFEELGIELEKDKFVFQYEILSFSGNEWQQLYLVKLNKKIQDMKISEREISEVKWLSLKDFEELLYSKEFVAHAKEYKDRVLAFIKNITTCNNFGNHIN